MRMMAPTMSKCAVFQLVTPSLVFGDDVMFIHWITRPKGCLTYPAGVCSLRIIAAITQESVITRILRHLKLASVPPPIAPARLRQEIFAFDEAQPA
jgi:hypothetical protein